MTFSRSLCATGNKKKCCIYYDNSFALRFWVERTSIFTWQQTINKLNIAINILAKYYLKSIFVESVYYNLPQLHAVNKVPQNNFEMVILKWIFSRLKCTTKCLCTFLPCRSATWKKCYWIVVLNVLHHGTNHCSQCFASWN